MGAQMQFEYKCKDWNQNSELNLIETKIDGCMRVVSRFLLQK